MDVKLYEMIFKRKSFHLFLNVGKDSITNDELNNIMQVYQSFVPLDINIKTAIKIVPAKETTCRKNADYCILLYSEKKNNYLQNIGYLGEQLDLYLVSQNIGTLWFGMGKTNETSYDGLDYVIMIAIKKVNHESKFRKDMFKSKRKAINEIWLGELINNLSDIVRFAPSACNSQPWIVENCDNILNVYRYKKAGRSGIMSDEQASFYNRIDIGIFLCFLDLCLQHNKIEYEVQRFIDDGSDNELILNAIYKLRG